jgi:hypothetical protein
MNDQQERVCVPLKTAKAHNTWGSWGAATTVLSYAANALVGSNLRNSKNCARADIMKRRTTKISPTINNIHIKNINTMNNNQPHQKH